MIPLRDRVAGAPISWGVCEVPGWGLQMAPERVLGEMADVGLRATELGPDGFLPSEPDALRRALAGAGLALVGGFVPAVLHESSVLDAELSRISRQADAIAAGGGSLLVLAASTGSAGYDSRRGLGDEGWRALVGALDRAVELAASRGLEATLHPHHGTVVEGPADVDRLLDSSRVPLCLDTGHLAVGGAVPARVVSKAAERVRHVHMKDVAMDLAEQVRAGRLGYREAVATGLYRPLGEGDVDAAGIVRTLEGIGYAGWYVLEQDAVIDADPAPGRGPVEDVRKSYRFLMELDSGGEPPGGVNGRERDAGARAGKEGA